jgi:glycerol kinase
LEGSIFSAGSAIQWLLDTMYPTGDVSETQSMAMSVEDTDGIYMVPAFTGLGAPYWDSSARAAILGLTPNSKIEHIFRAALEAVCYQTKDLIEVMKQEVAFPIDILRVDGGMVINEWLLQFLSDMLGVAVDRPACIETSALGAAFLAGLGAGIFQSLDEISALRLSEKVLYPQMERKRQSTLYSGWLSAVRCVLR